MQIPIQSFFALSILLTVQPALAQNNSNRESLPVLSADTITKRKYTLVFINKSEGFPDSTKQRLIDAFFDVYPKEAKTYNKKTRDTVSFLIDPAYKGVAATGRGVVRYNPDWFAKHPQDIDVVTHEAMHVVQDYKGANFGWITEGIADYVRYKFGVNNEAAGWSLPAYKPTQNFDNSYRVTARFFAWIEKRYDKKFVRKLDAASREKTYTENFAKERTGKTFAELWKEYGENPSL